jgi:glutathione S-transferase
LTGARHTDIMSEWPALKAHQGRCKARAAFQNAMADHLKPFEASAG